MSVNTIPLAQIAPSLTNPRKHFDETKLAELAESVRKHGILQPILVRPLPQDGCVRISEDLSEDKRAWRVWTGQPGGDKVCLTDRLPKKKAEAEAERLAGVRYQLVCGERRWRAAHLAELTDVPAVVRDLDEKAVLEVQVIENLQRADLHPMEEAEGYEDLLRVYGYTVEDLAAKLGKSKAYVYGRLKLTALCEPVREAFWKDQISASVALLLARIPHAKLQEEALKEACHDFDGDPVPFRTAAREIQRNYMLRLKEAPFKTDDPDLLPQAGPCSNCPKRTGNQPELFADVESADVCTDPECFAAKRKMWTREVLNTAEAKGRTILKTETVFPHKATWLPHHLAEAQSTCHEAYDARGRSKTWAQLMKKAKVEPDLVVDHGGVLHQVFKRADALKVLKEQGLLPEKGGDGSSDYAKQDRERTRRKRHQAAVAMAATPRILDSLAGGLPQPIWKLLAESARNVSSIDAEAFLAKRRGLTTKQTEVRAKLDEWFKQEHAPGTYAEVIVELLLCAHYNDDWEGKAFHGRFKALCELAGVDLDSLGKETK